MDRSAYMTVTQARTYLGISKGKMAKMIADGALRTEDDPLDERVKLILRTEVESLGKRIPVAAA